MAKLRALVVPVRVICIDDDGTERDLGIVAGGALPPIPKCRYWFVRPVDRDLPGAAIKVLAEWMKQRAVEGFEFFDSTYLAAHDFEAILAVDSLRTVLWTSGGRSTPQLLENIGRMPALERLRLPVWHDKVTQEQFESLSKARSLRVLDMEALHFESPNDTNTLREFPALTELKMYWTWEASVPVFPASGTLESLQIKANVPVGIFDAVASQTKLRNLEILEHGAKHLDASSLKGLTELESLVVRASIKLNTLPPLPKLKRLTLGISGDTKTFAQDVRVLGTLSNLEEFDFGNWPISNEALETLSSLPRLKKLSLVPRLGGFDSDCRMLQKFPALKELHLSWDTKDDRLMTVAKIQNLKTLELESRLVTDAGIAALSELKELRKLKLSGCLQITSNGVAALRALTKLESLDISETKVRNEGLAQLSALTELRELDISSTKIGKQGLETLRFFKKLRILHCDIEADDEVLGILAGLNDFDFQRSSMKIKREMTPPNADALSRLPMEYVWLDGVWDREHCALLARNKSIRELFIHADHDGLAEIANLDGLISLWVCINEPNDLLPLAKLPHLTRFTIDPQKKDSKVELKQAAGEAIAAHSSLIQMQLTSVQLSDAAAEQIAALPLLADLKLYSCQLSDKSLEHFSKLPSLRSLLLSSCSGISDTGLAALGRSNTIRLLYCMGIKQEDWTGVGFKHWPDQAPLETLSLNGSPYIGDDSVRAMAHLSNLKRLFLHDTNISNASLATFETMKSLSGLDVYGCKRLTYAPVKAFKERMEKRTPYCGVSENVRKPKTQAQMVTRQKEARLKAAYQKDVDAKTIEPGKLSLNAIAEFTRLGAKTLPNAQWRKLDFTNEVPAPLRQLISGIEWLKDAKFGADEEKLIGAQEIDFSGRLITPEELDQYLCLEGRPFAGWGVGMGAYLIISPLDTDMPEDPPVYVLDHEAFDEDEVKALKPLRLSSFLKMLKREPPK